MTDRPKDRVVALQRSLRIAKAALEKIKYGAALPHRVAEEALDEMWPLDKKQPLQGLVGHERRPRP